MNVYQKINEKIIELENIVKCQWGEDKIPTFTISYDLDSKSALGKASRKTGEFEIMLNKDLLEKYEDIYIKEVFIHEYAHLVIFKMFPTSYNGRTRVNPHGKEFKAVCSWFGIDGKASTTIFKNEMATKKSHLYKYIYKCECQEHLLTTKRHNLIVKTNKKYHCKSCKKAICFIGTL